jgi:CRP-like cAMP-binding protein
LRSEIDRFIQQLSGLQRMPSRERDELAAQTLSVQAPPGTLVVYRGETSDMAYFILKGSVGVGYSKDNEYVILNILREGDFFGEVAALTGAVRTANIITEEESDLLVLPSKVLRDLARNYKEVRRMFHNTMIDRLSMIDQPRGLSMDQQLLRELRTSQDEMEKDLASAEATV